MEGILSLELLLNLPKEILRISEEYDEYSGLIKREYFSNYDFIYMKEEINKQIDKYKNAKYFYRYPDEYNIKVTPTYELRESAFTQSVSNPIEKLIGSRVDDEIWTTDFYKKIINVSVKLTLQEAIYFVDSFFADRSEELISDKLGISRNTLQNIKKSCLIKVWFELKTLDLDA